MTESKNQKTEEDVRENLRTRVIVGVLLAVGAGVIVVMGGIAWTVAVAVLVGLATYEIYNLLELKGENPYKETGVALSVGVAISAYAFPPETLFALLTFSLIAIFIWQIAQGKTAGAIEKILMTYFGVVYIGWMGGAHAIMLREISREVPPLRFDAGLFATVLAIATTVMADVGAYFGGKKFGRIKLAPKISPNKTVEGFVAGLVTAVITALVVKVIFFAPGSWYLYVFYGIIASVFGLAGDLAESSLKRDVNVKDSGFILPGHGGILDRVDSLLFTIPITYYIAKYYLPKLAG